MGDGIVTFGVRVVSDLQELEIGELDGLDVRHLAGDLHDGRREVDVARVAVEADRDPALGLNALQPGQEVDMEVGAAELAVGDAQEPEVFLEPDDVADGLVLDAAQRRRRSMAPALRRSRASSRALGRRKLPTWSARNGGRGRDARLGVAAGVDIGVSFVGAWLRRASCSR